MSSAQGHSLGLGEWQLGLTWLPGESIFSLVCRFHHLACLRQPPMTMQALFGYRRSRCAHDFPGRLAEFVARTDGALGTVEDIIRERTLAPLFMAFRSMEDCQRIESAMRAGELDHVKFIAGITTSSFRGHHPLKACPRCIEEDRERFGTAYWHQRHQLPGVWLCYRHAERLMLVDAAIRRCHPLCLPQPSHLVSPTNAWRESERGAASLRLLRKLEGMAWRAHAEEPGRFADAGRLSATYRTAMRERALIGSGGRIQWPETLHAFTRYISPLTSLAEFAMLATTERSMRAFLSRLLYEPRARTHPLRHLAMAAWLFPDWEAFCTAFDGADVEEATAPVASTTDRAPVITETKRDRALTLLHEGNSPTAVAQALRVDVVTVSAWAASRGLRIGRRPKVLQSAVLRRMVDLLTQGQDKVAAAQAAGVSISTVTRIMRTEPGLQETWHRVRNESRLAAARQRWMDLVASTPGIGIKLRRRMDSVTFAWLYRHDRQWLIDNQQSNDRALTGNHATARWAQRDDALSEEIQRASLWALSETGAAKLTLDKLCELVPELRVRLAQLGALPRTQQVLEHALNYRSGGMGSEVSDR